MDRIPLDQDGKLCVAMKPRILKGTEDFFIRWELRSVELVSCEDTET